MIALSIHDLAQGVLAFDLIDLLRLAEPKVMRSTWKGSVVEAIGECSDELEEIFRSGEKLSGDALLRLAEKVDQVIDGDFQGALPDEDLPWLTIRAMDSSYYVVITADKDLCGLIKRRFRDVRDSPEDLAFIE